jgi:hypothetical protein
MIIVITTRPTGQGQTGTREPPTLSAPAPSQPASAPVPAAPPPPSAAASASAPPQASATAPAAAVSAARVQAPAPRQPARRPPRTTPCPLPRPAADCSTTDADRRPFEERCNLEQEGGGEVAHRASAGPDAGGCKPRALPGCSPRELRLELALRAPASQRSRAVAKAFQIAASSWRDRSESD